MEYPHLRDEIWAKKRDKHKIRFMGPHPSGKDLTSSMTPRSRRRIEKFAELSGRLNSEENTI